MACLLMATVAGCNSFLPLRDVALQADALTCLDFGAALGVSASQGFSLSTVLGRR